MIDFYSAGTPNGYKVSIALEEMGLDYTFHRISLGDGEQKADWYLSLNPNGKIPTIVDRDNGDFAVFESGAILLYLAEKAGLFMPSEPGARFVAMQWLMFQMGNLGPMLGQAGHFIHQAPEDVPYAVKRYRDEARRLFAVLDGRLAEVPYLAGDDYTVADMATFPWVRSHRRIDVPLDDTPHLKRWFDTIAERPAVQRGLAVPP